MPDQRSHVQSDPQFLQLREGGSNVAIRSPAVPGDDRGDTVHQVVVAPIPLYRAFYVGVNVDETGRHHSIGRIDRAIRRLPTEVADGGDPAAANAHIPPVPRISGA